jgi:hypothetical protein
MSTSSNSANSQHQQDKQQQNGTALPPLTRKRSEPAPRGAATATDFVSADVNEVLQDAREILTNRERRDGHPNERVLDESTTVKVSKLFNNLCFGHFRK